MKRLIALILFLAIPAYAAGPRLWGKSGTASIANAQLTVGSAATPFYPASLCIENQDASNQIFIDWSDGVATTADDSTNLKIPPGRLICFAFNNPNVTNVMVVGIISDAGTPAYNIQAISTR